MLLWSDHTPDITDPTPDDRPLVSTNLLTCGLPLGLLLSAVLWVPILLVIGAVLGALRYP